MRGKKRTPPKQVSYFAIVDACHTKECPVCWLVKARIEKYFDTLLFEGVNDVGFRDRFRAD